MPAADPRAPVTAQRILIYGVTGSGKSTAALAIAGRLGLPVHLADELAWEPGWKQVPVEELRAKIAPLAAGDKWVFDTAYGVFLDLITPRVELVIGLDYPRWFSFARLLRRTIRRVATREHVCNGNVETVGRVLGSDSILRWHARSFDRKRARMRELATAASGPPVLLFASARELQTWLDPL